MTYLGLLETMTMIGFQHVCNQLFCDLHGLDIYLAFLVGYISGVWVYMFMYV